MTKYLVDTNVLSEIFKKKPNKKVLEWLKKNQDIFLSAIVIEEIRYGLNSIGSAKYLKWFETFSRDYTTIMDIDEKVASLSAELRAAFRKKGIERTQADMLIAASARIHDCTIVTRNEKDFLGANVPIFNPF